MVPVMTVRILLKSWAMPPVSWPIGFHLLGLPDPVLRGDLVGEIAEEPVEHEALAASQRSDAQLGPELLAVAPQRACISRRRCRTWFRPESQKAPKGCSELFASTSDDDQFDEVLAERFLARPSENLFRLRIPVQDAAAFVDLDEGVERGIDDAARQLLALAQGFLR